MSTDGAKLCHIIEGFDVGSRKTTLCGFQGLIDGGLRERGVVIARQHKTGETVICDKCGRPRCQECNRIWVAKQTAAKVKAGIPR